MLLGVTRLEGDLAHPQAEPAGNGLVHLEEEARARHFGKDRDPVVVAVQFEPARLSAPQRPFQYPTMPLLSPTVRVADQTAESSAAAASTSAVASLMSVSSKSLSSVKDTPHPDGLTHVVGHQGVGVVRRSGNLHVVCVWPVLPHPDQADLRRASTFPTSPGRDELRCSSDLLELHSCRYVPFMSFNHQTGPATWLEQDPRPCSPGSPRSSRLSAGPPRRGWRGRRPRPYHRSCTCLRLRRSR